MTKASKSAVIVLLSGVVISGLACLCLAWQMGLFPDYGVKSGYHGQFNRVKHTIEQMPNVCLVNHWMHKDVSLEDFAFVLRVDGDRTVEVEFTEGSPQMAERDKKKIREFIEQKIASVDIAGPVH